MKRKMLYQLVDKTAAMLSELAKVVAHEKQLLEEFNDLFQTISVFEVYIYIYIPCHYFAPFKTIKKRHCVQIL